MAINRNNNTRIINLVIIGFIIIVIGGILFIFARHRVLQSQHEPPPPPENTEANLTIKQFHHVATENGIRKWTLEAASASLYAQQNIITLSDISVVFFMEDKNNITLKADNGKLNSKTNDMTLTGHIIAEMPPYKLSTESLNYDHHLRIIQSKAPVEISGISMLLTADSLSYSIDTEIIQCIGHVKGSFIGTIH